VSTTQVALRQYAALSRRSIVTTVRQPTSIIPSMIFPLIFLALTSSALNRSINLPGFPPVDSFLQFAISTTTIQGALFGAVAGGAAMATDIEGGFFERLVASPVARTSLLVGRLAGPAAVALAQALFFFSVATIFGLHVEGGIVGILAIASVAATVAAGVGAITVAFAIRTGSTEAVQGSFPLLFVFIFFSSAFFPRDLMTGWFHSVANINPLSHMIEGLRYQVIYGLDLQEYMRSLGIAAVILVLGVALSGMALKRRLAESG
jgi:ABC-2 type transport system permease protein